MSPGKPKILFTTPVLRLAGGGEGVAAWMLQALEDDYEVTFLTWTAPDFDAVNCHYGTSLTSGSCRVVVPSRLLRRLVECIPDDSDVQKAALLMRLIKRDGAGYAARIGCGVEFDFGQPGIQYIHYPYFRDLYRGVTRGPRPSKWLGGRRPWMRLSGYSFSRMFENLTLTNSDWTRHEIEDAYGIRGVAVYPPAAAPAEPWDWGQRSDEFVAIGRFSPEKRYPWMIEALGRVRERFPHVKLHLAGVRDRFGDKGGRYFRMVEQLAARHADWVQIHEGISREKLGALLARVRYGIHAMENEHFGMAPAEMLRAGCIPFVQNSGGQVEIVGRDPRVCLDSVEDASAKIQAVLSSDALQRNLTEVLGTRAGWFAPESFMQKIRDEVAKFIRRSHPEWA